MDSMEFLDALFGPTEKPKPPEHDHRNMETNNWMDLILCKADMIDMNKGDTTLATNLTTNLDFIGRRFGESKDPVSPPNFKRDYLIFKLLDPSLFNWGNSYPSNVIIQGDSCVS
jgi:hypothetical protein